MEKGWSGRRRDIKGTLYMAARKPFYTKWQQQNLKVKRPTHLLQRYGLPSSTKPSIRTWEQEQKTVLDANVSVGG